MATSPDLGFTRTELGALAEITRIVGESHDLPTTFHHVMQVMAEAFNMRRGTLALVDPKSEALTIRIAHGLDDDEMARGRYHIGEGITGRVAQSGEPIAVADLFHEPAFLNKTGARHQTDDAPVAFLCVPIRIDGAVAAVFSVDIPGAPAEALEADLALLQLIGGIVGQALRLHGTIAELREVRTQAEATLASMVNGVVTCDHFGRLTSINPAAAKMLGVVPEAALNKPYSAVLRDHRSLVRLLDAIVNTDPEQTTVDLTLFPPTGEPIPASLVWSRLRDAEGEPLGVVVTLQDRSELLRLERQVRRARRLAALGTMAAGVAHEVRNPLAGIRGAAQLMSKRIADDDKLRQYAEVVIEESERLNTLVESLLDFARPQRVRKVRINPRVVAEKAMQLIGPEAERAGVACVFEAADDVPDVPADADMLLQVVLNLCRNAVQAMPDGGTLTVRLRQEGGMDGLPFVVIDVRDTGCGMDRETLDNLFTPFFTTKPDGTGLGLAIAHRIMQEHGGGLDAVSEPNMGSTFFVSIPCGDVST